MREHLIIPDTQVKEGVDIEHIRQAGKLLMERKPDVVVVIGDWWDMPSLSTHTPMQKIAYDNGNYNKDLKAGIRAMEVFLEPMERYNERMKKNKKAAYKPLMVFCMGNHEYRLDRLEEQQPILKGVLPTPERYLIDKGFNVVPFKQAIVVDGITYCHYCPQTKSAGAVERAHLILARRHTSWTVGHSQMLDYFVSPHAPRHQAIIAGAFYSHDEDYKAGSNDHWRGLVYKTSVKDGTYDPEFISLDGLESVYG